MPEFGTKMVANDIQKPPYDVKAVGDGNEHGR